MEPKGLQTSEGKGSIGAIILLIATALAPLAGIPPEQLEVLKGFAWPIVALVVGYGFTRAIIKKSENDKIAKTAIKEPGGVTPPTTTGTN